MTHPNDARPHDKSAYELHPNDVRTSDQTAHERLRMTVPQAATYLGISAEAVRARIQRGTLEHIKEAGKVYVMVDRPNDHHDERHNERHNGERARRYNGRQDDVRTSDQTAVLSELRDHNDSLRGQVDHLRRELEVRNEELRRKDHLLAAALDRIPPELPSPQEPPGVRENAEEGPINGNHSPEPPEPLQRRSRLLRWFGF